MNWNTRSVQPKTEDLIDLLRTYKIDVAVLTETHLERTTKFSIAHYNIVRRDRTHGRGGGVAILVRDTLNFRKLPDVDTFVIESIGIELEDAVDVDLKIFAAYCPEQCQFNNGTARQFQSDLGKLTRGKFLICGDLNARHEPWDVIGNMNGKLLFNQAQVDDFTVNFPEESTLFSPAGNPSTLDIFLANFEINKPRTIKNRCADHHPVICEIKGDFVERLVNTVELNSNGSIFQAFKGLYQAVGVTVETFRNMINVAIGSLTNIERHSNGEIADNDAGEKYEEEVFEVTLDKPRIEDIKEEIKKLRGNKATSKDHLPSTLFKHGINALAGGLHMVITKIWQEDVLPQEWIENEVRDRRICKKSDMSTSVCCKHSAAILLNAAYRVLSGILFCRLSSIANSFSGKYRANTSTEAIFTLRQVLQKCCEFNLPTHHLFMDLSDALNTVDRDQLWQIMNEYGLPTKLTRLIKETTTNLMNHEATLNSSKSKNGLRPGCALSSLLFHITIEGIVRRAKVKTGGTIFQQNVQLISLNGKMDLIARSFVELDETYAVFKTEANRVGLVITSEMVKYMKASGSKEDSVASSSWISLSGVKFEEVDEYLFLDSLITTDNDTSKEIERRISAGERAYAEHLGTLESTRRSKDLKLDIYMKNIRPVILVGHETWTMLEKDQLKLGEFERKVLRTICNAAAQTLNGKKLNRTNTELYELLGEAPIVQRVKVDRLWWAGHVIRKPSENPVRMVLESDPQGTIKREGQRARWINHVEADLKSMQEFRTLWKLAKAPVEWERLLDTAEVPGALA